MINALLIWATLLSVPVSAQQPAGPSDNSPAPDRSYHLLREDDDWTFLADPSLRQNFWDPIKYIPLRDGVPGWYLTIGGEIREVWEQIGNDYWGRQPFMNGYFNQRYMLSLDAHYGKHVRTFVQFKSGLNAFRIGGPRPIDEKKLDFQDAFLEVGTSGKRNWIQLRAGIQEMEYGSGRLIDVREGPNVRLSFTGFKIRAKTGEWRIDGFAMRPNLDMFGFFDDAPNPQVEFWGVYATRPVTKKISVDAYYLGLDRKEATFQRGTAHEVRQTIGSRISRPIAHEGRGWDFDYEALWQFGSFGSGNIRAWTVASDTGYSLTNVHLKPRFSIKSDISSGDDPRSNTLGTFNPLFPIGNYFGVIATTGPGPINFIDVHPRIQTEYPHGITVSTDWVFYWRESLLDGLYNVPGFLVRPADDSQARFVGHRPGIEVKWQIDRHAWIQGDYGIFYAGQFLKQTMPGRDLNYWALWAGYKF
jgi:hypothetical protein